jgi:hypothetical protein
MILEDKSMEENGRVWDDLSQMLGRFVAKSQKYPVNLQITLHFNYLSVTLHPSKIKFNGISCRIYKKGIIRFETESGCY